MIAFGSSLITINTSWQDLKDKIAEVKTPYHYGQDENLYEIFLLDIDLVYTTQIHLGNVPESSAITQEQNDLNKADFEGNYKDGANKPFSSVGMSITTTAPRNDHEMIKDGLAHGHIDSSSYLATPYELDFRIPDTYTTVYLWGVSAHVKDFGDDDYLEMQIIDKDNILGYGENVVLKEYDQVWAQMIAKSNEPFFTPDGAPGELAGGLYARVLYFPSDASKTDIKLWIDYLLTVKS